jgi:hypothetical protein
MPSHSLSYRRSAAARFVVKLHHRNVPEQVLLADLQRVAGEAETDSVTTTAYERLGQFNVTTVLNRFGSWNAALTAAGLTIRNVRNATDDELFENFAEVWRKLGRQPVAYELVKRDGLSRFSTTTYQRRFGTWNKALQAFATFIGDEIGEPQGATTAEKKAARIDECRQPRRINWRLRAAVLIRDNFSAACAAPVRPRIQPSRCTSTTSSPGRKEARRPWTISRRCARPATSARPTARCRRGTGSHRKLTAVCLERTPLSRASAGGRKMVPGRRFDLHPGGAQLGCEE